MANNKTVHIDFLIAEGKDGLKKLTIDADGLRKIMEENVKVVQKFENKLINFAAFSASFSAARDSARALVATLQSVTGESLAFGKAMKAANTMAGKDSAGLDELQDKVSELSKSVPLLREQLAGGLYQVISNGVPEDNWMAYLEASARSAVGGMADLEKVVGVTATVIKNYGVEWSDAASIQDKIQLTAKNGVTSFEQLSQALPRVTGNAATLGVSIEELLGTFATLTGVSGNTAEVSTQLAAIFTALVKPSSEASEMAEKMGIQFDAAAIKAAGGFQHFLHQLDDSVKTYAAANGMLEQEVYGRLFGSAESLRALIPLQGELADKFTANVGDMENSAGTMDAAFNDMASTGEAATQMLKNHWAAVTDWIASVTAAGQPCINFISGIVEAGASVTILVGGLRQLNVVQKLATVQAKLSAAATRLLGFSFRGAATSATVFKVALRGLLITTGVGAALVALSAIVESFSSASDEAGDSVNSLDDATEAYTQAASEAKVQIEKDTKSLGELIRAKKSTAEAVQHLNETYGELFGVHKTAEEWYKILTGKSRLYVKQIGYEAQARALAAKLAEASINKELAAEKKADLERSGKTKVKVNNISLGGGAFGNSQMTSYAESGEYAQAKADEKKAADLVDELQKKLDVVAKKTQEVTAEIQQGLSTSNKEVKVSQMTWQQVADAIDKTEKKLKNTTDRGDIAELKAYNEQLKARKKALEALTGLGTGGTTKKDATGLNEPERPAVLDTLENIDKEINYQRTLRAKATAENIAGIDAEIARLETLRAEFGKVAHVPLPMSEIQTYEQLNNELSYYTELLEKADATQRVAIQGQIDKLNDLKKQWDDVLNDLKKPGDISTLDTLGKLDEAISYYQTKQKQASADEIQDIQRTILALERKRDALKLGVELPSMQRYVDEINQLTGREYKLKIRGMGFDELTEKISEFQRRLNDMDHPVTEAQRKDIERLIGVYEQWRKESISGWDTFRQGWDSVKGVSDGVDSLTSAIEGNGNAWQKATGIVDGFIRIYEGIASVVSIINMLSVATGSHTASKTAEATAVGASAGATAAEIVTNEAAAASQIPVIAANKAATASFVELAAAQYMAAHAYIPFVGFGIAAGFAASAAAMVQSIGLMPFANGGIVSGPTIGLIGEYAGAANNPEVVAPLDKLQRLIQPRSEAMGEVEFVIKGDNLVGVLNRANRRTKRT